MNEHETYLREQAEKAGKSWKDFLKDLAGFAMDGYSPDDYNAGAWTFVCGNLLVRENKCDFTEGEWAEKVGDKVALHGKEASEFWHHYQELTGVSPWAKDCRGCN